MPVLSNSLADVIKFFTCELTAIYSDSELQNITNWIFEKQLNLNSTDIAVKRDLLIDSKDIKELEKMCAELKAHRPIQYVLGEAEFYHLKFKVNESVLIPRPETEELVDLIIKQFKTHNSPINILDIGTGSGCIPIAIKKNIPYAKVFAIDVSKDALELAKYNANENKVGVDFFLADILSEHASEIILKHTKEKIDIIISNPPYILESEKDGLHKRVKNYEPSLALFVKDTDPILFYRKIAAVTKEIGTKNSHLFFECHANHAQSVFKLLKESNYFNVSLSNDMAGLNRFVSGIV